MQQMQLSQPRLEVSVAAQLLSLWDGRRLVKQWPCSTSKFGIGFQPGSNKTPLGAFRVAKKFGEGMPQRTVFKARQAVGEWQPGDETKDDLILSRILWLEGCEERNANTLERYIYIHGTNDEGAIGRAASHGCVRMRNADVASLYELVDVGTDVWIAE
jgi:L,D-peptidoglycan transpeptidase YkuD (ErfK/YbiS/YcfS/YnhG family)